MEILSSNQHDIARVEKPLTCKVWANKKINDINKLATQLWHNVEEKPTDFVEKVG